MKSVSQLATSLALAALPFVASACHVAGRAPDDGPSAECPVCKYCGDLACLRVHLEQDTPRCECRGETYYFCSDECRQDFEAHPDRYLEKH